MDAGKALFTLDVAPVRRRGRGLQLQRAVCRRRRFIFARMRFVDAGGTKVRALSWVSRTKPTCAQTAGPCACPPRAKKASARSPPANSARASSTTATATATGVAGDDAAATCSSTTRRPTGRGVRRGAGPHLPEPGHQDRGFVKAETHSCRLVQFLSVRRRREVVDGARRDDARRRR